MIEIAIDYCSKSNVGIISRPTASLC